MYSECKDFDYEILNHKTYCYYERPLEFYFEDPSKPDKLFVTKIFDWKYYIESGTLRDVLVTNYVKICKKPLIRKKNKLKFLINDTEIKDDLSIQDCIGMHDETTEVKLLFCTKNK